jgi:mono/diheme cytochrome c family protein
MAKVIRRIYDGLKRSYPRWSPAAYKLTLLWPVVAAVAIPLVLAGLPFNEFLNDMAAQPKGKSQMTYGRQFGQEIVVDRSPAVGSVRTDQAPYPFDFMGNEQADALWVGRRLQNPVPLTLSNVRRGQARFNIYCIVCHGTRAEGDGSATGPNRFPAPPSLHTAQAIGYADGAIFHIITKGTGKMPAYADKLDEQDRWKVIYYLRALQLAAQPGWHGHLARGSQGRPAPASGEGKSMGETPMPTTGGTPVPPPKREGQPNER